MTIDESSSFRNPETRSSGELQPLTAALLKCITPAEVVTAVVERGMAVLGAGAGLVALVTRDGQELEIVRRQGYVEEEPGKGVRLPLKGPSPFSEVVRRGASLYLEDRQAWAGRFPNMLTEFGETFQSSVSLPLSAHQHVFGAIHFSFPQARRFSPEDRVFLEELGQQCAMALERAQLLEEVEKARRYQEFLAQASSLLGESLDYKVRLESLAHLCVPELADWAAVDILAPDGSLLRLAVAHRVSEREEVMREIQRRFPAELRQEQSVLTVIRSGKGRHLPRITTKQMEQSGLSSEHISLLQNVGFHSVLCLPLATEGKSLGALSLGMALEADGSARSFTDESIALAEELSRRAAVAVDHARLFQAAEEAQVRAETVLESIGEEFYALDSDWRITYINQRASEAWGRSREEVLGKSLWDIFPQSVGGNIYDAHVTALRERHTVRFEAVSALRHRWIEGTVYPAEGGGISVYLHDVHERKTAEEMQAEAATAIQISEERYRRLLDTALEGILFLNADGVISSVNRQFVRMLGYDAPNELIGQPFYSLFFPENQAQARDRWAARQMGVEEEYELQFRRKDGSACWVIAHVSVERDSKTGAFLGTFTMITDITERRRTVEEREHLVAELEKANRYQQQSLRASEERFRLLVEGVKEYAIFLLNPDGCIATWNAGAQRFKGYSASEIIGSHFSRFYTEEDIAARHPWHELEIAAETGRYEEEGWRIRKDGSRFWAHVVISALRDEAGVLQGFAKVTRDVTERRDREKEKALAEMAEQKRRFLKDILAYVTEGRLILCDDASELPSRIETGRNIIPIPLTKQALKTVRTLVGETARDCLLPPEQIIDLITAASECAMNAVQHAKSGIAHVSGDVETGLVQVWIEDEGTGIDLSSLPRATLERGYSTGGSGFGHGFNLMLPCCQRIYLLTGPTGTTIVLEQERSMPEPAWLK